jgi:hypothetical protein
VGLLPPTSDVVGGAEHAVVVMGTVAPTTMGGLVSARAPAQRGRLAAAGAPRAQERPRHRRSTDGLDTAEDAGAGRRVARLQ